MEGIPNSERRRHGRGSFQCRRNVGDCGFVWLEFGAVAIIQRWSGGVGTDNRAGKAEQCVFAAAAGRSLDHGALYSSSGPGTAGRLGIQGFFRGSGVLEGFRIATAAFRGVILKHHAEAIYQSMY